MNLLSTPLFLPSFLGSILGLLGLLLVYWHSDIRRHPAFNPVVLVALLGISVGEQMMVLHLPGSRLILIGGGLLLLSSYSVWFQRKQPKTLLDYLKLCWVLGRSTSAVFIGIGYFAPLFVTSSLTVIGLWSTVLYFLYLNYLQKDTSI